MSRFTIHTLTWHATGSKSNINFLWLFDCASHLHTSSNCSHFPADHSRVVESTDGSEWKSITLQRQRAVGLSTELRVDVRPSTLTTDARRPKTVTSTSSVALTVWTTAWPRRPRRPAAVHWTRRHTVRHTSHSQRRARGIMDWNYFTVCHVTSIDLTNLTKTTRLLTQFSMIYFAFWSTLQHTDTVSLQRRSAFSVHVKLFISYRHRNRIVSLSSAHVSTKFPLRDGRTERRTDRVQCLSCNPP